MGEKIDEVGYMYNPNVNKIDKEQLVSVLQSIDMKFGSIGEDAYRKLLQKVVNGEKFNVEEEYDKIIDELYKERTTILINELQSCLNDD